MQLQLSEFWQRCWKHSLKKWQYLQQMVFRNVHFNRWEFETGPSSFIVHWIPQQTNKGSWPKSPYCEATRDEFNNAFQFILRDVVFPKRTLKYRTGRTSQIQKFWGIINNCFGVNQCYIQHHELNLSTVLTLYNNVSDS